MEVTEYITQQQRITELYDSLANPNLPDDLARSYMREFRELTGITAESGQITFYGASPASKLDRIVDVSYKVSILLSAAMVVVPVALIIRDHIRFKRAMRKSPVQERLDYILDEEQVKNYTTKQFQVAMAEASALLANRAMGLLSQEELEKVQAEICDPSPETEDIQKEEK